MTAAETLACRLFRLFSYQYFISLPIPLTVGQLRAQLQPTNQHIFNLIQLVLILYYEELLVLEVVNILIFKLIFLELVVPHGMAKYFTPQQVMLKVVRFINKYQNLLGTA